MSRFHADKNINFKDRAASLFSCPHRLTRSCDRVQKKLKKKKKHMHFLLDPNTFTSLKSYFYQKPSDSNTITHIFFCFVWIFTMFRSQKPIILYLNQYFVFIFWFHEIFMLVNMSLQTYSTRFSKISKKGTPK